MAMVFFRWAIQATDSTFTGCTAKIMAAKKSPGNGQLPQDDPNQQRLDYVQYQVGDVIAGRVHAPLTPFDPERGICYGPVVVGFGGAPKLIKAVGGLGKIII